MWLFNERIKERSQTTHNQEAGKMVHTNSSE